MQIMSKMENIESNVSTTDEDEINEEPMIESENFLESYNLELLFGDTKDDKTDKEVSSDKPSGSEINDGSSNGGKSQDVAKGDSNKEADEKCNALKTLAEDAFNAQDFTESLIYLNEAIKLVPNDALLYTSRAVTYINLCCYTKAIEDCEAALKFSAHFLKAWLYMAKCYFVLGEEALSKECIREAIARNPNHINEIELYEEDYREHVDIS